MQSIEIENQSRGTKIIFVHKIDKKSTDERI